MSGGSGNGGGGSSRDDYPVPIKPEPKGTSAGPGEGMGGGSGGGSNPCALQEITYINSPVASVIAGLSVGDILQVQMLQSPRRVVVTTVANAVAGSITAPFLAQLILCLDAGYLYEAEVLRIQGGVCKIEVRLLP